MVSLLHAARAAIPNIRPSAVSRDIYISNNATPTILQLAFPSRYYNTVCGQIDEQGETTEHYLRSTREPGRIEQRLDVVLNEPATVSRFTSALTERILERRQGTDPPAVLDDHAPDGRRNVEQRHPPPTENEQSAQYDKEDEREMND
jgi:hypothetical protein